jgi:hypothetical protein
VQQTWVLTPNQRAAQEIARKVEHRNCNMEIKKSYLVGLLKAQGFCASFLNKSG